MAILGSERRRPKLSAADRATVLEMFHGDRQVAGFDFTDWCENVSQQLGVEVATIREEIAKASRLVNAHRRLQAMTLAQQEADMIGACQIEALATLRDSLKAVRHIPVVDKDRMPVLNAAGEMQYYEIPDNAARVRAACALLDVHGAKAPKKVEISGEVTHTHKSETELLAEFNQIMASLKQQGLTIDVKPVNQIESGDSE